MEDELYNMMSSYFEGEDEINKEGILRLCIKRAINSYKSYVNYPNSYSTGDISDDMENHIFCLFDLAVYWAVKQGTEFQNQHIENSTQRTWTTEGDIFASHGIVPFCGI